MPSNSISCDSMTSCILSPISDNLASIPASFIPVFVAALTASNNGWYFGLNATVNAQSIIVPFICVPKSVAAHLV